MNVGLGILLGKPPDTISPERLSRDFPLRLRRRRRETRVGGDSQGIVIRNTQTWKNCDSQFSGGRNCDSWGRPNSRSLLTDESDAAAAAAAEDGERGEVLDSGGRVSFNGKA